MYEKFSNRCLIQWGQTSVRSGNGQVHITLPTSFSKAYGVALSNISTNTGQQESGTIQNKTNASFKVFAWGNRATGWIAVGS